MMSLPLTGYLQIGQQDLGGWLTGLVTEEYQLPRADQYPGVWMLLDFKWD